MNPRIRRYGGLAAAALAILAVPSVALAGLQPQPAIDLFSDDRVADLTVAASAQGDVIVGWTGQNNPPATVLAAGRSGDGPFAPVEFLSTAPNGERPGFVFEPDGTALAVWSHATNTVAGEYASRPRGGVFGPAANLPSGERFARVAIDANGTALAVWKSFVAGGDDLVVGARRPRGGAFEAPVPLSAIVDDNFIQPAVAVNGPGTAVVAWERTVAGADTVIEARIGSVAGPSFGPVQPLATATGAGESLSPPQVAIGPDGEAIVVWSRETPASTIVEYAVRPASAATFGPAQPLADGAGRAHIAMDATGTAVIAFSRGVEGSQGAVATVRPAGGSPGPVVPIGPLGQFAFVTSVSFDGAGAAIVASQRGLSDTVSVGDIARRPAGGIFEPAITVADGPTATGFVASAEPDGDVTVAWSITPAMDVVTVRVARLVNAPDAAAAGRGQCAAAPPAPSSSPAAGRGGRVALTPAQLLINQRISQAAIRRLNAVETWLNDGLLRRDLCGGGVGAGALDPAIRLASGAPALPPAPADPRPVVVARAGSGAAGDPAVGVSPAQLLINQRISQAAVRRANALEARLATGLTGGDLRDDQISQVQLAPGLRILATPSSFAVAAASATAIMAGPAGAAPAITVSARQLRINQRISQAAVRRANRLVARLEAGFSGADFRAGSISPADLIPDLRRPGP